MKRRIAVILAIVLLPVSAWGSSYLYCEYLTKHHGEAILADIDDELVFPSEMLVSFKVLKYNGGAAPTAKVYTITESIEHGWQEGWVSEVSYHQDQWSVDVYGLYGWSGAGSADDPVWPYSLLPG